MVARLVLEPGDTVILNNQRTLHGRESFKVCRWTGAWIEFQNVGVDGF